jgi:hypothetical protein
MGDVLSYLFNVSHTFGMTFHGSPSTAPTTMNFKMHKTCLFWGAGALWPLFGAQETPRHLTLIGALLVGVAWLQVVHLSVVLVIYPSTL